MKKQLILLFISLFIFSACELGNQITDPDPTPDPFVIIVNNPTNNSVLDSNISINGSSFNESGLDTAIVYYCKTNADSTTNQSAAAVSGSPLAVISSSINIATAGYYNIWITATDNDNRNAISSKVLVKVEIADPDVTPPLLSISSHTNNQIVGSSLNLQGVVSDDTAVADILYNINQNAWFSIDTLVANWQQTIVLSNTGLNTVALYAIDTSGNTSLTQTLNLNYDSSVPIISIDTPTHGISTNVDSITVSGTASVENDTIQTVSLKINNGSFQDVGNTSWSISDVNLIQGTNTLTAQALTTGGKTTEASVSLYVDSISPTLNITSPSEGYTATGSSANITVAGTVTETGSGLEGVYLSTGGSYVNISSDLNWSSIINLPADDYTLSLYSKDLVGNSSATQTINISITNTPSAGLTLHFKNTDNWSTVKLHYWDVIPAQAQTSWPGVSMTDNGDGWWTYTITNATSANVIFNGGSGQPQTANLTRDVEGWYVYSGSQWYDQNPDDVVPPTVNLTAPNEGALLQGIVTLSATAADDQGVVKVEFYYNAVLIDTDTTAPYSIQWNSAYSPNGAHTITAKAYDLANATVSSPVNITTSNPNLPPVADAGKDITIIPGGTAKFTGSDSSDPNGTIVSYQWSNGLSGVSPQLVYNSLGTNVVTLTVTDNDGATDTDTVTVYVVETIPHNDFREETVYFIMTDRFADGDSSNNEIWGGEYTSDIYNINDQSKTGVLSYYHGGDFQGIINNLDYIQGLGFTAIWITPVVKQPEGRHDNGGDYSASPFHGYWGYDFDQIDPHLHSSGKNSDGWDDFDALVDALHDRDMKLMLDIVVNHGHPTAVSPSSPTYATRNTVIMDGQSWTWETGDPYWNASQSPHVDGFFSYANGTGLVDLIDFNENGTQNATSHLKNVYKRFIDHGVDAFRIDTVAYMTAGWWEEFTVEMKSYASNLGNDHFYMCGEAWTGDRTAAVDLIYNGHEKAFHMLDLHGSSMDFPGWMGKAFKNEAGFGDENGWARITGNDGDASGKYDPTYLATFVDNHDVTRANGIMNQTQYMNNLSYIYLFRGIPVVYYGTEILYSSWPNYITTTDKNDVVARWMLGASGISYVNNNQPTLSKHIKMLNSLRRSSTALQKGQQVDLNIGIDSIVFQRDAGVNQAFVAFSKGGSFSYTLTGIPNGTYRLITPDTANATYNESTVNITDGSYTFTVAANSFTMLDK